MELDQLKNLLRDKLTGQSAKTAGDIELMLRSQTHTVLHKLRRSLYFELVSCIVVILAFAFVALVSEWQAFQVYFGVFAVVFIFFMAVIVFLIKNTNQAIHGLLPLKDKLSQIISIIQVFIKRYFQFTMLLLPVCFFFSFALGYNTSDQVSLPRVDAFLGLFSARWQVYTLFAVYYLAMSIGLYYFTRWYLNKLYGKYLRQLILYLQELESV